MSLNQRLLAEIKAEAAATRRLLERVPFEKADFKPHEKSMSLGRLATHVAEISDWWNVCLVQHELDFSGEGFVATVCNSTDDLLAIHDKGIAATEKILLETPESEFLNPWTMRNGEQIYYTAPKSDIVRTWCLNHLYHHRGQLTVYLRLLDVALPSIYGPTADM